ncbi:recombinase family protein, partial [Streptococcus agalactiae]|nr:recombinase family protein [Streptococcus agalactiae]
MMTTNKVAIYVRVSTTNQAEEGYSIEEQKDKLSSYCNIKDWSIYNIYTDGGFSGANTERPALEKLIKDAKKKKFDTVLVYKLDRLSRSQKDTLYLIEDIFLENNIDFVSLLENFDTSTPFGKAMVGILSVFAQLEREQIKERMQLGKLGRAKSGKSMMWAKVAYGYDYHIGTGEMTVNPWQSITVRSIYDWYLSGKSITKIRDALNDNYPKSPAWSYRIVRQILCNPVYCGYNQYKGEVYKGNHEPIVSKKVFDKVQEELKVRQRKAAETGNPRPFQAKYMLSGIAQCGYCHAPLKLILGMIRKDGTRFMKYECYQRIPRKTKGVTVYNNNEKCNSGYYYKEDIEAYVLKEISRLQNDIDYLDEIFDNPETTTIDHDDYQKQID